MGKFNLNQITQIYNILKSYDGINPYIKSLKKGVYEYKNTSLNDFHLEYIHLNHNKTPKNINKIVKIASWWAEKKKDEWNIDFTPKVLKIGYFMGETEDFYHIYVQYRQSQTEMLPIFIPKNAILTNFLSEDWTNEIVDFSHFNKLGGITIQPHQERAVKFLKSRKKGIVSLEQGLGKTLVSIVAALECQYKKILVICPASLKINWKEEIERFEPSENISIIEGSNWKENKFTIINYDLLKRFYSVPKELKKIKQKSINNKGQLEWTTVEKTVKTNKTQIVEEMLDNSQLFQSKFDLIIIDEAHRLSNKSSNMYEIVEDLIKRSKPQGIFELTGTMIKNNPQNLYNILKLIDADVTKNWIEYMTKYCGAKQIYSNRKLRDYYSNQFIKSKGKNSWNELTQDEKNELDIYLTKNVKKIWIMGEPSNLDELSERIKHIYYREVNDFSKLQIKKEVILKEYNLTQQQKREYTTAWENFIKNSEEKDVNKLIQNHKLIEGSIFRQVLADFMVENTIKLAEDEIAKGKRVIIFCCFDKELYALQDYFKERCVVYNGKLTLKKKDEVLKKFKENEEIKVFLGNIQAASVGLNLNECSVVIFNNVSFVPSDNVQGEFRCLRLGQTKDVTIYYQKFIDTYQDRLFEILDIKNKISNDIIKDEKTK